MTFSIQYAKVLRSGTDEQGNDWRVIGFADREDEAWLELNRGEEWERMATLGEIRLQGLTEELAFVFA